MRHVIAAILSFFGGGAMLVTAIIGFHQLANNPEQVSTVGPAFVMLSMMGSALSWLACGYQICKAEQAFKKPKEKNPLAQATHPPVKDYAED